MGQKLWRAIAAFIAISVDNDAEQTNFPLRANFVPGVLGSCLIGIGMPN